MLEIGSVLDGKYKILNVIGKGGMSVVYLAMNERANKQWAVKEVRKDGVKDYEVVRQGLIAETNLLKRLKHPNLPSIIDVIDDEDTFLIVMDYIEGVPLSRLLEEGPQPQEQVVDWAIQLCDVLQYLHSQQPPIIYRDMKPSNIMLRPDGTVVLIDFGTARTFKRDRIEDTACLGTIGYAAPEQFGGRGQTDERTDIYCLGTTLYHLLTGQNPSEPPYEIYPVTYWNPALSTGLEGIVCQCTQQNPEDRYQDCTQLLFALRHYHEYDLSYQKEQNKKLFLFGASVALMLVFICLAVGTGIQYKKAGTSNYEYFLKRAQSEVRKEDAIEQYKSAIEIEPSNGEAYSMLLDNIILEDDVLSQDEAYAIRDILNGRTNRPQTNEELFAKNTEAYEKFAYDLGIAYFYTYEDAGNKTLAKKWLETAANSTTLAPHEIERAKCLGRIAGYYSRIGVESKSGDTSISYTDYWEDLLILTEGNLADKDNATTALVMYKELVYQIYTNGIHFKEEGIQKQEIKEQLDKVRQQMAGEEIQHELLSNERTAKLYEELEQYIKLAENSIDAVYEDEQREGSSL